MPRSHGSKTVVMIDTHDLSPYMNDSDWTRDPDVDDVTTYGMNAHDYDSGLGDGTSTLAGFYDTNETDGPAAVLLPLEGKKVPMVYRPEGTGPGLPERTVTVLVGQYKETHPVAGWVAWTCNIQHCSVPVYGVQA